MIEYIIICIVISLVIFFILHWIFLGPVFGQDVDPRYYCIEKLNNPFPYTQLCKEQVMKEVMKYTDRLEK